MAASDPPDDTQAGGWLPPEPAGDEPVRPAPPQPPPAPAPAGPQPQQPPAWGQPYGYAQQPYGQGHQSPYGYSPQTPYGHPRWSPAEPDNTPGVAGFICSVTSIGTLFLFFGVLSFLNLPLSIAGVIASRNGVKKVERGETRKHRDLSQWGYWLGIAGIVLSVLALAAWIAVIASDPTILDELDETEPR